MFSTSFKGRVQGAMTPLPIKTVRWAMPALCTKVTLALDMEIRTFTR